MAGGFYTQDPQTGMPVMQTPGGQPLYLPLSPDDMALAGAQMQGPPGAPAAPPAGPDMRLASNAPMATGPAGWGNEIPRMPDATPGEIRSDMQAQLGMPSVAAQAPPPPSANAHASRAQQPDWMPRGESRSAGATVDPSTLVRPGQPPSAATGGTPARVDGTDDPLVQQAMAEALRQPGGGGGPRALGVTGQTRKFYQPGAVPDEVRQRSADATNASDAYNEQLAMSVNTRQQQAYDAQTAEYAGRAQALAEQRAREAEQQRHLDEFEKKWDAQSAEAAQMKAPQMEQYWGSMSTMAKMATAISITLGGALQGLRGGSNPGLEMSNQAIDRWIAEQKDQYSRARDKANVMGNQYARMVQSYGSQNLAEQRLRDQAYGVRDAMMRTYAQKIGTPSALEAFNQAQLESEAQRAKLQEKAYADAGAEIEEKLSMQGGGGAGKPKGVLDMLRAGAEAKTLRDKIAGAAGPNPGRAIEGGKTETLTAALQTIDAADEIESTLGEMGAADDDTDDPRSGAIDYLTKNIPGTNSRKLGQNLDQATTALARGIQQTLGKSDNDAKLADQMATGGGGSGRERVAAARRAKEKAIAKAKIELSGLTPDQRVAFIQALPPDQAEKVLRTFNVDTGPAGSEQPVR